MRRITLPQGQKVVFLPRKSPVISVNITVTIGHHHELPYQRGIAHLIEHMLFEGTTKRKDSLAITNEIERLGGELNAYTVGDRTSFYGTVVSKHAPILFDVLTDMMMNPLFEPAKLKKEKDIIIKEIDSILDDPRLSVWLLFTKKLFKKHPAKYPGYGTKKTVQTLSRKSIITFFQKYYTAPKTIISIVGPTTNLLQYIHTFKQPNHKRSVYVPQEPPCSVSKTAYKHQKLNSAYTVVGYLTVPRAHPDSYVLDVIDGILGRGQSGKLFDLIRSQHGLAYEINSMHSPELNHGYYAIYTSCTTASLKKVQELIQTILESLTTITDEEVSQAKEYIEGSFIIENENPERVADALCFWEHIGSALLYKEYLQKIRKIKAEDVKRVARKYFRYPTTAVISP